MPDIEFITDRAIYEKVLLEAVPMVRKFLWIATADIKDLHVHRGNDMVPFLEVLSDLIRKKVSVRLIHAKEAGEVFRKDFDRFKNLFQGLERLLCPRAHFKCVIVDGIFAYSGSANLTGAGMGAKSPRNRNFESGIITRDSDLVKPIMEQFDGIWMGRHCGDCGRREYCADYQEMRSG
jgi:phosphatidylserine/phosphatidylglycerophosphate/cardiolipin synthase-like enzyme